MYLLDSDVTIVASTIRFNQAEIGGAIFTRGGTLEIKDSSIFNNTADVGSVVSACAGTEVSISNDLYVSIGPSCIFYENNAVSYERLSVVSLSIFILTSIIILH